MYERTVKILKKIASESGTIHGDKAMPAAERLENCAKLHEKILRENRKNKGHMENKHFSFLVIMDIQAPDEQSAKDIATDTVSDWESAMMFSSHPIHFELDEETFDEKLFDKL